MKTAIIIGAGPAGLTAAYELLTQTDIIPIIIESESQVGGLSKTINYKGNKIDIGGHRFFSKSEKIIKWWLHFLPLEINKSENHINIEYQHKKAEFNIDEEEHGAGDKVMMVRPRKSRIYYRHKFFDYPLQLNGKTIRNLGIVKMVRIGFSYIWAKIFPSKPEKNLAQFFCNRFGKELYKTFFKDYTEKVWGVPCEKIPSTWGQQRIKDLNISKLIWHAIKSIFYSNKSLQQKGTSTSLIEQFLYPKYGPGQMWEAVAEEVIKLGGKILLNTTASKIVGNGNNNLLSIEVYNELTTECTSLNGDYFFSTMPIKELTEKLDNITLPPKIKQIACALEYRDFLIVGILSTNLSIKEKNINETITDNWIYVQDNKVMAGRLQFFHNWSPFMVSDTNHLWLGVEYFCNENDKFWQQDDETIKKIAIDEMTTIGILKPEFVKDAIVVKVKKAYPSYYGSYNEFSVVQDFFNTIDNLFLIGRNGMHRYNNTDHSMLTAMTAVQNIKNNIRSRENIWQVNLEDEYHEEST